MCAVSSKKEEQLKEGFEQTRVVRDLFRVRGSFRSFSGCEHSLLSCDSYPRELFQKLTPGRVVKGPYGKPTVVKFSLFF